MFNKVFEEESSKYTFGGTDDEIIFMRVHCRKHLNFCTNKMWDDRIMPAAEVYYINEQDKIELVDFDTRHRSGPGIQSFFIMNGLIDDEYDPPAILERCG